MPGLYSRIKNWVAKEKLLFSDLNNEFNNVINNFEPLKFDDYSANVTQMQTQSSPGGVGSESLATTLAGELERIRYAISRIVGKTYWYEDPGTNLQSVSEYLAAYLPFEEKDGIAQSVVDSCISRGVIINAKTYNAVDFSTTNLDSTNKKFGSYSASFGSGKVLAYPGMYGSKNIGSLSCHFRNVLPNEYIAWNPNLGIALYMDGSGNIVSEITQSTAATQTTKSKSTVTGVGGAGSTSFQHACIRWLTNNSGNDLLKLSLAGAATGSQLTAQTIRTNPHGKQGVWFFGMKPNNPTWTKFSAMSVTPDAESSVPWTVAAGSGANGTVSNGILTVAGHAVYQQTANVDLSNMIIDFKVQVSSFFASSENHSPIRITIRDDSMDRSFTFYIGKNSIQYAFGISTSKISESGVGYDFSQPVYVRLVFSGATNPKPQIWLDGKLVHTGRSNTTADATVGDILTFGNAIAANTSVSKWEWMAYKDATSIAPITENSIGNIDDIAIFQTNIADAQVLQFATTSIFDSLKKDLVNGVTPPVAMVFSDGITNTTSGRIKSHADSDGSDRLYFQSDGKTEAMINSEGTITVAQTSGATAQISFGPLIIIDQEITTTGYNPTDLNLGSDLVLAKLFKLEMANNAGAKAHFSFNKRLVLPSGLHSMEFGSLLVDNNSTVNGATIYLDITSLNGRWDI